MRTKHIWKGPHSPVGLYSRAEVGVMETQEGASQDPDPRRRAPTRAHGARFEMDFPADALLVSSARRSLCSWHSTTCAEVTPKNFWVELQDLV